MKSEYEQYVNGGSKCQKCGNPNWTHQRDCIFEPSNMSRKVVELEAQIDQLRVQLAGCMIAAEGGGPVAVVGDYGWSPAYQHVVELRKLYDQQLDTVEE